MGEALVVGGGVLGCAVALRLADSGLSVVLAASPAGRGGQASRAAGAMLGVFSEVSVADLPARRDLDVAERLASRRLYEPWVLDLAERSGVALAINPGLFVVGNHDGEDDEQALAAITEAAISNGCRAEPVPWREVPGLRPDRRSRPCGVVHLADEGSLDAGLLLEALETVLVGHPMVEVVPDRVVSLGPAGDEEIAVRFSSATERRARQVVLAAGAETTGLLVASEGLEHGLPPILAGRGVSVVVRSPLGLPAAIRTPNRGFACGTHVVPRHGAVYLGATNRLSTAPVPGRRATLDELSVLFDSAAREINPEFRHAELVSVAIGGRPVTLDALPLVGRTWDPRLLVATATYRNGILLAPRVAELLGGEVLEPGAGSAHPFSPRRELKVSPGSEWLSATAGRSLVAQLTGPDGRLAVGRAEELERFLQVAIAALLEGQLADDGLRRKLVRLSERAPLGEAVPLVFETIARHGGRNGP